jgi:hypothetical protein
VGFVVDKEALWQVFSKYFDFLSVPLGSTLIIIHHHPGLVQ